MVLFLEDYERKFIDRMQLNGVAFEEAAVCILMYFHEFSRPIVDMPFIISMYSAQLTDKSVSSTFKKLVEIGLINIVQLGELSIYKLAENYEGKLEEYTGIDGFAHDLLVQKTSLIHNSQISSKVILTSRGVVSAEGNYQTLLTRLYSANNTIKSAMLCSKVYENTAIALEKMAEKGVRIQILIASDKIVKMIRGKSVDSTYSAWKERLKDSPNIEIREFNNVSATELCSSYLIDGSVLRFVVFDSATMRSLDGFLLEVVQEANTNINLINWYQRKFDLEWENAKNTGRSWFYKAATSKITWSFIGAVLIVLLLLICKPMGLLYELSIMLLGACTSYFVQNGYSSIREYYYRVSTAIKGLK